MTEANGQETREITKEELDAMPEEQRNNLMMIATKVKGVGVVKRADGTIRYDDPDLEGTYGEEHAT